MNKTHLFSSGSLYDWCNEQLEALRVEASRLMDADDPDAVLRLRRKFELRQVELEPAGITRRVDELGSGRVLITILLPYTGSSILLTRTPSAYSSQVPPGVVSGDTIVLTLEGNTPSAEDVRGWEDRQLRLIQEWLQGANADAAQFYSSVATAADKAVADRQTELKRLADLRAQLDAE